MNNITQTYELELPIKNELHMRRLGFHKCYCKYCYRPFWSIVRKADWCVRGDCNKLEAYEINNGKPNKRKR